MHSLSDAALGCCEDAVRTRHVSPASCVSLGTRLGVTSQRSVYTLSAPAPGWDLHSWDLDRISAAASLL